MKNHICIWITGSFMACISPCGLFFVWWKEHDRHHEYDHEVIRPRRWESILWTDIRCNRSGDSGRCQYIVDQKNGGKTGKLIL